MEIDWAQIADVPTRSKRSDKPVKRRLPKPISNELKIFWFLKPIFIETLWLILLMLGLCYGGLFLTQSPQLAITSVRFDDVNRLDDKNLMQLLGPIIGKNILTADLSVMASRLERHPWVREVYAERRLPDTIKFRIVERTAMARILLDRTYVMDNFGVLLSENLTEFTHLPLVDGIEGVKGIPGQKVPHESLAPSLQMIHYLNRLPFFQSDPVYRVKVLRGKKAVFLTRNRRIRIKANLSELEEGFDKLKILLSLSGEYPKESETIDLSFRNQVVVKPTLKGNDKKHLN